MDLPEKWKHIREGFWTAGNFSRGPSACDIPKVHLSRAGSNSCYIGFNDPDEAEEFKTEMKLGDEWKIADLRDDRDQAPGFGM